jgi:hypothetical protein
MSKKRILMGTALMVLGLGGSVRHPVGSPWAVAQSSGSKGGTDPGAAGPAGAGTGPNRNEQAVRGPGSFGVRASQVGTPTPPSPSPKRPPGSEGPAGRIHPHGTAAGTSGDKGESGPKNTSETHATANTSGSVSGTSNPKSAPDRGIRR